MFELSVQATKDATVDVKATGRIVQSGVSPFEDLLADTIHDTTYKARVLLNLEDVEFVDSSGISWLLTCHKRFRESGGKLVIHSCAPAVLKILRVLRMDQVFNIASSPEEAKQMLSEDPHE